MNLTAMARAKNQTPAAFAEANIHADGMVGKLARMYYIAQGTHGTGKSKMDGSGDKRTPGQMLYQIG